MNALHLTNAEFRSLAARVTDIAADLLAGLDDLRAFPPVRGEQVARAFEAPLPEKGLRARALDALGEVLALSRDDFIRVIERSPKAMREMLALLARMIRRASGRIEDLVFLDVAGRVAKCLLDLSVAQGESEIELTQDDLASFVGATRVSVNRALADLETQGAISVGRRHLEVKDAERLRRQIRY